MLNGDFTYEFSVYPFAGNWRTADLHRRAIEYNFPLVAVSTAAGDGSLGNEVRLFEAGSPNVIVSALYGEGAGSCVRLYEYQGIDGIASLKYLLGLAQLTEVDLAGQEGKVVSEPLTFRPWQIRTFRIKPLR